MECVLCTVEDVIDELKDGGEVTSILLYYMKDVEHCDGKYVMIIWL
jgi:hypothetical protein